MFRKSSLSVALFVDAAVMGTSNSLLQDQVAFPNVTFGLWWAEDLEGDCSVCL